MLAALAGIVFALGLLGWSARIIIKGTDRERLFAKGVFGALLWIFFQAQGENLGFIGEPHITPLIGILVGYLLGFTRPFDWVKGSKLGKGLFHEGWYF